MKYIKKIALIALAMAGFNIQASEGAPEITPAATQGILSSLYSKLQPTSTPTQDPWAFNVKQLQDSLLQSENRMLELGTLINASSDPQEKNLLLRELANEESIAENLKTGISSLQENFLTPAYNKFMSYVPSMDQLRALPSYSPYFGSQWGTLSRNQQIGAGLGTAALLGALGYGAYRGGRSLYNRYMQPMGIASMPMSQDAATIRAIAQQRLDLKPEQRKQHSITEDLIFIKNANIGTSEDRSKLTKSFFLKLYTDINGMQGLQDVAKEVDAVIKSYKNADAYADVSNKKVLNNHINKIKAAIGKYLQ